MRWLPHSSKKLVQLRTMLSPKFVLILRSLFAVGRVDIAFLRVVVALGIVWIGGPGRCHVGAVLSGMAAHRMTSIFGHGPHAQGVTCYQNKIFLHCRPPLIPTSRVGRLFFAGKSMDKTIENQHFRWQIPYFRVVF